MSYITDLKVELDSNPTLYESMTVEQVVGELNDVDKQRDKASMTRQEIYSQIEAGALTGLSSLQLDHLNLALADTVDPFDANIVQVFTNIFGEGSSTLIALAAARVETVSRATVLGLGRIRVGKVEQARAL